MQTPLSPFVLQSFLSVSSDDAKTNRTVMQAHMDRAETIASQLMQGGSESARDRHQARGKLLPRTRIDRQWEISSALYRRIIADDHA